MKYLIFVDFFAILNVAPARERGLKFARLPLSLRRCRRSREGAWIEMLAVVYFAFCNAGRSREGAWIEMFLPCAVRSVLLVAPARERGLKSAGALKFFP